MELIKNHRVLGDKVKYEDSKTGRNIIGIVTGVRHGNPIMNMKTKLITKKTYQLRIKPADGSRAFWTTSMLKIA